MNSLQDQGRALYKRGDYAKAIECFDRAIGRAESVQLVDNRAACHEKLKDLPAALKDAKKAIGLGREDPTGYLRAGKVLTKMDKPAIALDIYSHGLRSVRHVGQGYELLKKVHKETLDIISPPKSVDPLTMLPRELAETILEHLSFRERVNASRVSKGWAAFIRSTPNLWTHLDLSHAHRKVPAKFISRAINVGRSRLRKASLNRLWDFDKTLVALVKQCQLEELVLLQCGLQGTNLVRSIHSAKHLKSFNFGRDTQIPDEDLAAILKAISDRVEAISVTVGDQYKCIPASALTQRSVVRFDSVCEKLTSLTCTWVSTRCATTLLATASILYPNIKFLAIHQRLNETVSRPGRQIPLAECKQLLQLDLEVDLFNEDRLTLPPSLVRLRLAPIGSGHRPEPFLSLASSITALPCLQELSIVGWGHAWVHTLCYVLLRRHENDPPNTRNQESATDDSLLDLPSNALAEPQSKLRRLAVDYGIHEQNGKSLCAFLDVERLRELEHLAWTSAALCDDDEVSDIVKKQPKLRTLDLTGSSVTGVGVKEAAKLQNLEELVLDDCRFLGEDAVEWARAQGLRVRHKMKKEISGAKKVRY
ncbi:uncharacterized protein LTR77_002206 [Saxophila tyrrhenica]|uniref:F-box domain-containing protein n=1 Tax=Saxophila tyrrhenica TaxID=1690608 RepID=A0AAV9PII9_9PEZI|nr:hypothetical protein LTR77_002206 [Saxophila tyrrhenica]